MPGRRRSKMDAPALPVVVSSEIFAGMKPKVANFAMLVAAGFTQREAFNRSHPQSKGSQPSRDTSACKLMNRPEVRAAIAAIRATGANAAAQTVEGYVERGMQREQEAVNAAEFTAASRFYEIQGRALGYVTSNGQGGVDTTPQLSPGEVLLTIQARFGAEAAQRAARSFGMVDYSKPDMPVIEGEAVEVDSSDG